MLTAKKIRKHVVIIHAYSLMSALQRKIVNVLFYTANNNNAGTSHANSVAVECRMPFSSLSKAVNFSSNNTKYLKEAIDGLASLKIEWNLLRDKAPSDISFLNLRVLHGPPTFYQDGTFNFSFHKLMLDLVQNPAIYGTIDLDIQAQFESKYGISLYENSTRFVNLQKNKVIDLSTFRKLLGVNEDIYPSIREFTRNVITPSVEEVNDRADFVVNLEAIKSGRKIIGFDLSVNNKKRALDVLTTDENCWKAKASQEINHSFGAINNNVLESILRSYEEEYIFEKIEYTKKYAKKERTGLYPIAYFISALKNDYKIAKEILPQAEVTPVIDESQLWKDELYELQLSLSHWQKMAKFDIASSQINSIQKIIAQCEEKLAQHLLTCPEHVSKKE